MNDGCKAVGLQIRPKAFTKKPIKRSFNPQLCEFFTCDGLSPLFKQPPSGPELRLLSTDGRAGTPAPGRKSRCSRSAAESGRDGPSLESTAFARLMYWFPTQVKVQTGGISDLNTCLKTFQYNIGRSSWLQPKMLLLHGTATEMMLF